MAKADAVLDQPTPAQKSGPSLIVQIGVLLVMTLIAIGLGFVSGNFIKGGAPEKAAAPGKHAAPEAHGEGKDGEEAHAASLPNVVTLPPITTNLASPSDTWVRMELAVVFAEAPDPNLTETIHQDILAFLRTVKLHQVQGASGFQHLKVDLEDRVKTRSDGKAVGVLIRTLLYE